MATIAAVEHHVNELQQALVELARQNDKTARSVDATTRAVDRLSAQNDRTARAGELASKSIDRLSERVDAVSANVDRLSADIAEFKNESRRADAELRSSLNQQNAKLSDTLGRLAEDIVGPSIPSLFKRFFPGDKPQFAMRAVMNHKISKAQREFDTPAWNDKIFLVSETKSRLRPTDLDSLEETISEIRNFFVTETEGRKVCGALASLCIDPSLVTAGERRGFLMIALGNNLAEVLNSEGSRPKEF